MRLTLYTDYSMRVLMHAAMHHPGLTTIDEVANTYRVSRNHIVKVVQMLGQNGFLETHRGAGGGFTLSRPAGTISLGDVVRLTETDEHVIDCMGRKDQVCRVFPVCRLKGVFNEAAMAFFKVLDSYTVADLVKRESEMKQLLEI